LRAAYLPGAGGTPVAFPQVGYAISRRCGNAVTRNRLRRRLRAIVADLGAGLDPGVYLITAEPGATGLDHEHLARAVRGALDSAASAADKARTR
jgi:ribonuclease P protein component